jgi:cobalt-zinc-cadmium efflux system membrane fusion protein
MKTNSISIRSFKQFLPFLLFALAALISCTGSSSKEEPAEPEHLEEEGIVEFTEAQFKTAGIVLSGIEQKQLRGVLKVNGLLDVPPQNLVSISVPYGGILKSTDLLQGMWVSKGQVIARMEHPDYIQLQQDYLEAASQLTYMQKEFERQEALSKENVSAAKTLEKTTAEYRGLQSRVEGLRQKLALLNIDAGGLSTSTILSSIRIIAPISGYITEVNANIGKFVQANDVIFEIVDTRHLHAELMVFEKDIPKLKEGQTVRYLLANETKEREAEVHLIGREISAERTIRVHCHLKEEDKNLLPGMYLKAVIETGAAETSALPDEAIVTSGGKKYIFVQTEGIAKTDTTHAYHFKMVEVQTGISENEYTEVNVPEDFNRSTKNIVVKGAYDLLSKMNNSEEEHGH